MAFIDRCYAFFFSFLGKYSGSCVGVPADDFYKSSIIMELF